MRKEIDDGGPAFPTTPTGEQVAGVTGGRSLRDWFAGQALAQAWESEHAHPTHGNEATYQGVAERSFLMADAMLAASKSPKQQ